MLKLLADHSCYFNIICLQESWMGENDNYNLINFDGYELFKKDFDPELSRHGGLLTYINKNTKVDSHKILNTNTSYEGLLLHISLKNNKKISILNIYRPPRNLISNYQDFFSDYIPKIKI